MKKALYALVPLLLIILIIFSIGWYLFEYDPDFTRDMLLDQARYQDEVGNHAAAVWFYDIAYRQSQKDDAVAMELADQYLSIGNYSKAEYTLSNAIADGGSIDLYIALCNTYVEQNKLLDAVTMLNNIADPEIKAQLDALRPTAPVPSHAPGTYSQYISVAFTAVDGVCYLNADRRYPSMYTDLYTGEQKLSAGETVFFGLAVAENGLVSPLGVYSYIVGGVIEEVSFVDAHFEQALRQQLGYDDDRVIYSNELWEVTEFIMPASATDYTDLKWLPKLEKLTVENGSFITLSHIAQLTQLRSLSITQSILSSGDLKIIAALPELQELTLSNCQLSTIADLAAARKLRYLDIGNNTIRDIKALSGMKELKELHLSNNAVISLEAIGQLTALETLYVSYNSLASTAPLSGLYNLVTLDVSNNGLMDLSGIEKLTGLKTFLASNNNLVNIDALAGCTGMIKLDVSNNTILNLEPVAAMVQLEELYFSNNEVAALPQFSSDSALWTIDGKHNLITTLDPLAGLHELSYVYMDYNEAISSVDCLQTCHLLLTVSVFGTKVSDVTILKEMSVKVYYDPT